MWASVRPARGDESAAACGQLATGATAPAARLAVPAAARRRRGGGATLRMALAGSGAAAARQGSAATLPPRAPPAADAPPGCAGAPRPLGVVSSEHAHCVACGACRGLGVTRKKLSKRVLQRHREAAAAAAQAGRPPPPRPSRPGVPCAACAGTGLQAGPAPAPLRDGDEPAVAVVGGGIGGAALALALQQRGVAVRVYERDSSFAERAQGYALAL